jgi:hypothetical protein
MAILASGSTGCAYTSHQYVTPWFRITTHHAPMTIMAESGGPKDQYESQWKDRAGTWTTVSDRERALAVCDSKRVVYSSRQWIDGDDASGDVPCDGSLYLPTEGRRRGQMLCVKVEVASSKLTTTPVPMAIHWIDPCRMVAGPVQDLTLAPSPYDAWSERDVIGFVDDEAVIAVENQRPTTDDDYFPGKECTYFSLGPAGRRALGKPVLVDKHAPYVKAEHEHCTEADVVRGALSVTPRGMRSIR